MEQSFSSNLKRPARRETASYLRSCGEFRFLPGQLQAFCPKRSPKGRGRARARGGVKVVTASVDCAVGSHRFVRPKLDGGNSALTQAIGSAADLIKDVKEHITGSGNWTQGGDQYAAGYAVECDSVAVKRRVAPIAAEAVVADMGR